MYRSTTTGVLGSALSPGPGLSTSYTDTTATNGTNYYYVVKASNAVGESLPSNEASATPSAPATAPSAPQSLGATAGNNQVALSWSAPSSNGGSALTSYTVYRSTTTGVLGSALSPGPGLSTSYTDTTATNGTTYYYVVKASNAVGESLPSNEASATPSAPATAPSAPQSLGATAGNNQVALSWSAPSSNGGSALTSYTVYRSTTTGVLGSALSPGPGLSTSYTDTTATNGTNYYYVVKASNAVGESLPSNEASATPSAPATAPSAPQSLGATAGNNQVALSWSAPSSNGGSALTSYTVYRSTTTGVLGSALSPGPGLSTSYTDTTATNGTNYYYVVKASNAVGESLPSNEASATPSAPLLPPVEPLPVVDSFNRRNENPLSGAGLWSNGIIGSAETGLRVMSNQLECTRTTTCTAWRNNTFYGPDTEASARITTLPGNGNSFLLYVRLNQAGAGGSGYRLWTLQQSGVDQVFIERIDGGVIVTLLTMNQELAVGDTLLLRATGQSLEAWHKRGTAWTKLGAATDSAYQLGRPGRRRASAVRPGAWTTSARARRRGARASTGAGQRRQQRADDLDVALDRDAVELAVDQEPVEAAARRRRSPRRDPRSRPRRPASPASEACSSPMRNSRRAPRSRTGSAMRSAPWSQPASRSSRAAGGPSERAPQCASTCRTSRSPSPYSVSS